MRKLSPFLYLPLFLLLAIVFYRCTREDVRPKAGNTDLTAYIQNAKKEFSLRTVNSAARYAKQYYIDYNSTFLDSIEGKGSVYLTPVYTDSKKTTYTGHVIGYVLTRGVFNVMYHGKANEDGSVRVHAESLRGDLIGHVDYKEGVIGSGISEEPPIDGYTTEMRSWFGCTRECVNDAEYACTRDLQCAILLLVANYGGMVKGLGSMSMFAACGIVCAKNRKLDLLPNH